jgi:hypothetical protein
MDRMLIGTHVLVVKTFYQSNKSGVKTRQIRILLVCDAVPDVSLIRRLIKNSKNLVQLLKPQLG